VSFSVRTAAAAAVTAVALLPTTPALAKKGDRAAAPATPAASVAPASFGVGPLDVSGVSFTTGSFVDAATGVPSPVGVHIQAIVGGSGYQVYDEFAVNVRPVGGDWDPALDFPHAAQPAGVGGYVTAMLSTTRAFAPGAYEARVAARQGATWIYDEAISGFTMP